MKNENQFIENGKADVSSNAVNTERDSTRMAGTEPLAQRKEKDMGKGKRIVFTILAWIVSHFTLHIAFAAANNNNTPVGLIAIISICIAGAVYSFTGKKGKVEERSKNIETDNKKGKSMSDETNDESISTVAKEFIKKKESPNLASFNGHIQTEIEPKNRTGDIAINENKFYEQIWREIEENKTDLGLWAKCFSTCEGDENKTKALYVNERVLVLKENLQKQIIDQGRKAKEEANSETKICPEQALDNIEESITLDKFKKTISERPSFYSKFLKQFGYTLIKYEEEEKWAIHTEGSGVVMYINSYETLLTRILKIAKKNNALVSLLNGFI